MLKFSLPTFIKYCHFDDTELLRELSTKLNSASKGHSFHWSLKAAIHGKIDGLSDADIDDILNSPQREAERKYNRQAYENFKTRFGNVKNIEKVDETRSFPMHKHDIEISVSPWFMTEEKGIKFLHVVWATTKPSLQARNASIGTHILAETFKTSRWGNSHFCVMDLTVPKRFSDKNISASTVTALELTCARIHSASKKV